MKAFIKVLIHIGGIVGGFFAIVLGMMITDAIIPGLRFGYLINFAIIWFFWFDLPKRLCARLDAREFEKEAIKHGMIPKEYASTMFHADILDTCEKYKNNKSEFEDFLKHWIKEEFITKVDANVLRYVFRGSTH